MVADERRVDALRLEELADELVEQPRRRLRRRALHVVLRAEVDEERARLLGLQGLRQLDAERLLEAGDHRDAAPLCLDWIGLDWIVLMLCVFCFGG